jgi:hypothetical protein
MTSASSNGLEGPTNVRFARRTPAGDRVGSEDSADRDLDCRRPAVGDAAGVHLKIGTWMATSAGAWELAA